jgi:hypothetical protein
MSVTFGNLSNYRLRFRENGLFPKDDVQVTSGPPQQARSESVIAVNPRNTNNLIAASKKFSNPASYRFTIGIRVSFDGGQSWEDATLPTLPEWGSMVSIGGQDATAGMTDPALAFDDFGNAWMVGEPIGYHPDQAPPKDLQTIGMYIYNSTDGGLHWSAPTPIHVGDLSDDKSWIACDNNPGSPHYGNIYVAWGASSPLRFARSTDHGHTWEGVGTQAPGSVLTNSCFAPEISVGLDGTVHIVWHIRSPHISSSPPPTSSIQYTRSTDGGETFEPQKLIVTSVHDLDANLQSTDDWPHFRGAQFRVMTLATGCGFGFDPLGYNPLSDPIRIFGPRSFIVAWSDYRDGAARIYYRASSDGGVSFDGPPDGQRLSPAANLNLHHFHPQIVCTGSGVIGCAYYEYQYISDTGPNLLNVKLSASFDKGKSFAYTTTVSDRPWDPAVDAPASHGDDEVTFIGEYFGLDADESGFDVLWTDTRTGVQELFFDRVETSRDNTPEILKGISGEILFGIIQGGEGIIVVNGHLLRVPPRGPIYEVVQAIAALDAASKISGPPGRALTQSAYAAIGAIAEAAKQRYRD